MSYDNEADRTVEARLAIFMYSPRPGPPTPENPNKPGPMTYHCIFFDLCRTPDTPRHDWREKGKNLLSIDDMRVQRFAVHYKEEEFPELVAVYKWEFETHSRTEFVNAMEDVDGLVLIQDIGKEAEVEREVDIEKQMEGIAGFIAEAKGMFEAGDPGLITPNSFPVPVSVMAGTLGGRVGNRNREEVKEIAKKADWIYTYISTLSHEMEIAQNIVKLVERIKKRGVFRSRLVPGLVRPRPTPKSTPKTPKATPPTKALSPALPETPASQLLHTHDSPSSTRPLKTPKRSIDYNENPVPPLPVASGSRDESGEFGPVTIPRISPKRVPRIDIQQPKIPPVPALPASTSSGSLRSVRPHPFRAQSSATSIPKNGSFDNTVAIPDVPRAPLRIQVPPAPRGKGDPIVNVLRNSPPRNVDLDDYVPEISTAGQGDSILNNIERFKNPLRPAPLPPKGESFMPSYFDMEGGELRGRLDSKAESSSKAAGGGLLGKWGRAMSVKGSDGRSGSISPVPGGSGSGGGDVDASTPGPTPGYTHPPRPEAQPKPAAPAAASGAPVPTVSVTPAADNPGTVLPGASFRDEPTTISGRNSRADAITRTTSEEIAYNERMMRRFGDIPGSNAGSEIQEVEFEPREGKKKRWGCCVVM